MLTGAKEPTVTCAAGDVSLAGCFEAQPTKMAEAIINVWVIYLMILVWLFWRRQVWGIDLMI